MSKKPALIGLALSGAIVVGSAVMCFRYKRAISEAAAAGQMSALFGPLALNEAMIWAAIGTVGLLVSAWLYRRSRRA